LDDFASCVSNGDVAMRQHLDLFSRFGISVVCSSVEFGAQAKVDFFALTCKSSLLFDASSHASTQPSS
jgi:hypothetical protein